MSLMDLYEAHDAAERDKHLPTERAAGIAYFAALIDRYHAAALANDPTAMVALHDDADRLALKLNGGKPGTHNWAAKPEPPGCWLPRETAAPVGTVPKWGQQGDFTLLVQGVPCRVTCEGLWGYGFDIHAVDWDAPFISPTGYQSCLEMTNWAPMPVDAYMRARITAAIAGMKGGKLVPIEAQYRKRGKAKT